MCEIADRIRREGKEEGRLEGKIEDIIGLLEDLGQIPQQVIARIRQETNPEQLGRWLKCAARSSSIAEFEKRMI